MMQNRIRRVVMGALMGVLIGISGNAIAAEKAKLSFAYLIDPSHEAVLYAIKEGIVKSDTVDLELVPLDIAALVQATSSRRFDLIQTATTALPRALAQGLQVKIVGTALRFLPGKGLDVVVRGDSPLQLPLELKGKTIGVGALNATSTVLLRIVLAKKYGMNVNLTGGDIVFGQIPNAAVLAALNGKKIDAAQIGGALGIRAQKEGHVRTIVSTTAAFREIFGVDPVSSVILAYSDRLNERPDTYKEALRLIKASREYLRKHSDAVYSAVAASEHSAVSVLQTYFNEQADFVVSIEPPDINSIKVIWAHARELGVLPIDPPNIEDAVWSRVMP